MRVRWRKSKTNSMFSASDWSSEECLTSGHVTAQPTSPSGGHVIFHVGDVISEESRKCPWQVSLQASIHALVREHRGASLLGCYSDFTVN